MEALTTIGHGTLEIAEIIDRLAHIDLLVDVRRFPGSRRSPQFGRERLAEPGMLGGIEYRWEERLGGRRHLATDTASLDPWWNVEAFRAYAAHTRTTEFQDAMDRLVSEVGNQSVAVMCSESVWWRCHRRLIADVACLRYGIPVHHLLPGDREAQHRPAAGARLRDDGLVVWDGVVERSARSSPPG